MANPTGKGGFKMTTTTQQWEEAWGEYIEALEQFDRTFPERHRRGKTRPHNHSKTNLRRARCRLEKLDPEFCTRTGIS